MTAKFKLGCLGLLKPEMDLIRTILRTSTRLDGSWELVPRGKCNALMTYNTEKDFEPYIVDSTTKLITIRRRGEVHPGYIFYKPFRADELVDVLILIQSDNKQQSAALKAPPATHTMYKLKKWPSSELLSRHKNYNILSVYLSRSPKSIKDLVTLSGLSEDLCSQFVSLLNSKGLLLAKTNKISDVAKAPLSSGRPNKKKRTLMSLLRDRLGIAN